jgi:hypothetical protein
VGVFVAIYFGSVLIRNIIASHSHYLYKRGLADEIIVADLLPGGIEEFSVVSTLPNSKNEKASIFNSKSASNSNIRGNYALLRNTDSDFSQENDLEQNSSENIINPLRSTADIIDAPVHTLVIERFPERNSCVNGDRGYEMRALNSEDINHHDDFMGPSHVNDRRLTRNLSHMQEKELMRLGLL